MKKKTYTVCVFTRQHINYEVPTILWHQGLGSTPWQADIKRQQPLCLPCFRVLGIVHNVHAVCLLQTNRRGTHACLFSIINPRGCLLCAVSRHIAGTLLLVMGVRFASIRGNFFWQIDNFGSLALGYARECVCQSATRNPQTGPLPQKVCTFLKSSLFTRQTPP